MQRCNKGDVPPRDHFLVGVAIELEREPLRAAFFPVLCCPGEVQSGAEVVTMAEDDAAFGFVPGAQRGVTQLFHQVRAKGVALVRTVEADKSDLAFQLVGDHFLFTHKSLLVSVI